MVEETRAHLMKMYKFLVNILFHVVRIEGKTKLYLKCGYFCNVRFAPAKNRQHDQFGIQYRKKKKRGNYVYSRTTNSFPYFVRYSVINDYMRVLKNYMRITKTNSASVTILSFWKHRKPNLTNKGYTISRFLIRMTENRKYLD
jgi:hypothetical protein